MPVTAGEQVVVVHDDASGGVLAVAVGNELGPRRTGALGGVAAQRLARAIAASRPDLTITELGALVAGEVAPQRSGRRVFLSVGLAGTEVHLLGHLSEPRQPHAR